MGLVCVSVSFHLHQSGLFFFCYVGFSRTSETQVIVVYYFFFEGGTIGKEAAASAEVRGGVTGLRQFTNLRENFNDRLWRFF